MCDLPLQLGLVALLVLLNAIFAGSELALVSLREDQLRRMETESAAGEAAARLARDPNRFLATIQIGITLAGFLASASAAVTLSEPLRGPLEPLGAAARPVSVVVVTVVLSYLTLVAGELAPKRLAMQWAERWSLTVARPLAALAVIARPVVWLLSRSTDLVVRALGGDPSRDREEVSAEALRDMVAAQRDVPIEQRRIIEEAFELSGRTLEQVMQPRPDVFTLDGATPCADASDALAGSGYSRAPVCDGGGLDDVIGMVHLRDLLVDGPRPTTEVAQPILALPETASALDALHRMRADHSQIALVVDEHGAVEGIVTVEDLVEELVGEIYDETDSDEGEVRTGLGGSLVVPGRLPIHDLADHGVELPDGDYATVAGFVLDRLQYIPDVPGDEVVEPPWRLRVTGVDDLAITEIQISGDAGL